MRRQHVALLTVCLLFAGVTAVQAQEPEAAPHDAGSQLAAAEAMITTTVMERQPADEVTNVPADIGRVYFWTRITGAEGEIQLEHVWYHGEDEMARVPLNIAAANWRTWSSKNIEPTWTGDWRVDVVAPDGSVVKSVSFSVGSSVGSQ